MDSSRYHAYKRREESSCSNAVCCTGSEGQHLVIVVFEPTAADPYGCSPDNGPDKP
ncbi:MAG: hypothetical protein VXZ82_06135 [Planctomycetota bacterium]|nr:hypothetical protein [Planctomycetota bacterium]